MQPDEWSWPQFIPALKKLLVYGLSLHIRVKWVTPVTQSHSWVGSTAAWNWEQTNEHHSAEECADFVQCGDKLPALSTWRQQVHLPLRWAPGWKDGSMRSLQMLTFLMADSHWFNSFTFCLDHNESTWSLSTAVSAGTTEYQKEKISLGKT